MITLLKRKKRKCEYCKKEEDVIPSRADRKYCSERCYLQHVSKRFKRRCIHCNIEEYIISSHANRKYCSERCYLQHLKIIHPERTIICLNCINKFVVPNYARKIRFCSKSCASKYNQKEGSWNKGIPHTEKTKLKMSLSHHGRIVSEETRTKMSLSRIGMRFSEEHKKNLRVARSKRSPVSEETRKKLSIAMKKRFINPLSHTWLGKHHTKETKIKIGIASKERRKKQILPKKDTSIEIKIQNFLKQLGIAFFTHQYIKEIEHGYQCDILIPAMNLIIECDGDYWHNYPIGNDLDYIRTQELLQQGFKVLRLWEREIRTIDLKKFKEIMRDIK